MLVRLAFAVAIHVDPEILLVDEALAVGDVYFRQRCMRKIHDLRQNGVTILFVSHATADAKAIGDRAMWLDGGRIREIGDTENVVTKYLAAMLEKDTVYREHHGGDRRAEDRRHARGGAGHQQGLALGGAHLEELRKQRTDGAAGHDDRAFGTERAAAADGDRRRQGFQHRDFRRHPAAADQDRLDGLGNAVPADLLGAIADHEADHETANGWSRDHPGAAMDVTHDDRGDR